MPCIIYLYVSIWFKVTSNIKRNSTEKRYCLENTILPYHTWFDKEEEEEEGEGGGRGGGGVAEEDEYLPLKHKI